MSSLPVAGQAAIAVGLLIGLQLALAGVKMSRDSRRNLQHWSTGQGLLLVSYVLPKDVCVMLLFASTAVFYYLETYQTKYFRKYFGAFLRPGETMGSQRSGAFFFLLGTAVTACLFPMETGRFALQCLSTVDPVASFVGRNVRSPRINSSTTLAGSIAGFATACAIGCLYAITPMSKIVIGALTCCVVEASPYGNDNFWIPVVTAAVMEAASLMPK